MKMGTKTLESACAERGQDWEEIMEQREREDIKKLEALARRKLKMESLGLTPDDKAEKPDKQNNELTEEEEEAA